LYADDFFRGLAIGLAGGFTSGPPGSARGRAGRVFRSPARPGLPQWRRGGRERRRGGLAGLPAILSGRAVVVGLVAGTDIGARLANRFGDQTLRRLVIGFIVLMAAAMAQEALR
jgi:hypothetical protein